MDGGEGERNGSRGRTHRAFLGLGGNLGDRASILAGALAGLGERAGRLTGISSVYETEPVGYLDQPPFLNLVAALTTPLQPRALLEVIRELEGEAGRRRTFRNAPRPLDIDILLYDDRRIDEPGLTVPHPRMTSRAFVLVPLLELAPVLKEPGTGRGYREYLEEPVTGVVPVMPGDRLLEGGELPEGGGTA